ncbi:MAG TPA: hypothetical protein EYG03_18185 [Planctomycetes bacterium]|nr:hypothetical protein [Fuerstiella sp.]HIK93880.1 hypothetical protein [Planctomycetota bacterium]
MCFQQNRAKIVAIRLLIPGLMGLAGCMNPGMYHGRPYGQPMMYAPPQSLNQASPGLLQIPESDAPPYDPQTYDRDPDDDFDRPADNGQFFEEDNEDFVPDPRDPGNFDNDLGGIPTTQTSEPGRNTVARPSSIQPVGARHVEYGFDTKDYHWLRGVLRYDGDSRHWTINYSVAGNDQYGGTLSLAVSSQQIGGLTDGDPVDVHGHIDPSTRDSRGRDVYRVDSIRRMAVRIAM